MFNEWSSRTLQLTTYCIVNFILQFKSHSYFQTFVVVLKISSDVILESTFINGHGDTILIRRQRLTLNDLTEVPVDPRAAFKYQTGTITK